MRVIVAAPVAIGALERHLGRETGLGGLGSSAVTPLVLRLVERGHAVTVVTLDPTVAPGEQLDLRGESLRLIVGAYRPAGRARDAFATERRAVARGVADAVSGSTDHVVHAHWSYEFALGAIAASRDALVSFHDWSPRIVRLHPHPYRLVRLGMQATVLRRSRYLTAVSPVIAERMRRWTSTPVDVVPNGIPDDAFAATASWRQSPLLLAVAAGFSRWKNIQTLLRAFPLVRERSPDAELRLVGDGHGPSEAAESWARQAGLDTAGVTFVGRRSRSEVFEQMAAATALVHPSLEEACPMVVIEAMAHGLPVVGGERSGGVPWAVGSGGVLADVTDPRALADGILRLVLRRERWVEAATAARERASSSYRLDRVTERYEELYRVVAQRAG